MNQPIVVGTDGSPPATNAVIWAAEEAARRQAPLQIVHALLMPYAANIISLSPNLETEAKQSVDEAAALARKNAPDTEIEARVINGNPAQVLRTLADEAQLLVIGSRGRGGFTGLLLGSVGLKLAGHVPCPVVVVRENGDAEHREVVVGIDGDHGSGALLELAFMEAKLRGARLRAVHCWTHPTSREMGEMVPPVYDVDAIEQEEARLLAETISGWRGKFPDIEVIEDVRHVSAAEGLADASTRADLVVVGSHHAQLPGILLGSVAHAVLHHAHSPVAVVRC